MGGTEHRRSQGELRRAVTWYGALVDHAADALFVQDDRRMQRAEQVFEALYTSKPRGLDIGLSISRSIVEAHGGRLWAQANAPHGTVFALSLPVGS